MPGRFGPWASMAGSLLIALCLSTLLRPTTAALNRTLGTVWPFSTVHCDIRSAPGCEAMPPPAPARAAFVWR